ncbi:MAG: U32 family peptidase [Rhizobiales bacterium]|nr:U32 family peptidase [Hyphomicrobiales bacterium]NRB14361.1 U32 family peptidase [Hyphomicrobiales bacterium]
MQPKLTIGPILFHWSVDQKLDFYKKIADETDIDTVYLGEIICSKRAVFFDQYYEQVADKLKRAGKKVVYSTLAEVLIKRDRNIIQDFCDMSETEEIEVNDASALLHISGKAHRLGPMMNVYNEDTLAHLAAQGAYHASLPCELPRQSIKIMAVHAKKLGVSLEMQVFGRMPLALSARCYHARAHKLTKDGCQFVCEQDPDGMVLKTLDNKEFLAINGIQTLSYSFLNLTNELKQLQNLGVEYFRLSPHTNDMVATANVFNQLLNDTISPREAMFKIRDTGVKEPFANGFYHQKAGNQWVITQNGS